MHAEIQKAIDYAAQNGFKVNLTFEIDHTWIDMYAHQESLTRKVKSLQVGDTVNNILDLVDVMRKNNAKPLRTPH